MSNERPSPWLTHIFHDFWMSFEQYGVTKELYAVWSKAMRRPIYKWLDAKWNPPTRSSGIENTSADLLKIAKDAFINFLANHPELPTAAIRPLIRHTLDWWYGDHGYRAGSSDVRMEDENRFMDIALRLFRDGEIEKVRMQQATTRDAVLDVEPWVED